MRTEVWEDIWFLAIGNRGEYSTDIRLYEITALRANGTPMIGEFGDTALENYGEVEPFADGWVKWDGCSEWSFEKTHCCNVHQLLNIGEALARSWEMASELIEHWNSNVAKGRGVSQ